MPEKNNSFSPLPPWQRTDYCGTLRAGDAGREVALWGWVATRRDHGGLVFIDLRDREGIVQLVFNPAHDADAHEVAAAARSEYYVAVKGTVVRRQDGTINSELPTGEIEIAVTVAEILNPSNAPPFPIGGPDSAAEEIRLKYRYLDLRRDSMQRNLRRRHQALRGARNYLDASGFIEIETPILFRATPEGARDYLVPSRVNPGKFYALPQSPQLLKQILMVGGFDRYYQIARCFRDEDLRANRQPEFSQIDIEMTGPRPEDIYQMAEGMMASIYKFALDVEIDRPLPRMPYAEAIDRFGSDKPDLRFGLELKNLTAAFAGTSFKVFADVIARGEAIYGLALPGESQLSRRELDELTESIKTRQGLGLAWAKVNADGWQGPIAKFIGEDERKRAAEAAGLHTGDTLLMVAGPRAKVCPLLGDVRLQLGAKFNLRDESALKFLWVVDFPLFDYSDEEKRLVSVNHPFTAPNPADLALLDSRPLEARALAYDMVLNGQEMGGGSIRIHNAELQLKVFELLGIARDEAAAKFGFLLDALGYGAPPHGGIAFGVDRIAMMVCGTDSLRDVMAFPKTQKAVDPMSGAPSEVDARQLRELSIKGDTVKRWRGLTLMLVAGLLSTIAACNKNIDTKFEDQMNDTIRGMPFIGNDTGLNVHAVRSIKQVIIHKIAVMPLIDSPDQIDKSLPSDASESVTAQLYAQATVAGGWQVVPQDDVSDAMQQLPPTTSANMDANAIALGKKLAADGVLYGSVNKYRERVGFEYSAQTPAAVAFTLNFVDEHSGQIVWTAKYAREQKALAENVFDLPTFIANKGRWVRAHDIAQEGIDASLANLYSKLTIQPVVQGQ